MNKVEYEAKCDALFERWKKVRPEYENKIEGKRFSPDGIMNYEAWINSVPKILFLLKENHAADGVWEPWDGITVANNIFGLNIARWRQILIELNNNPAKELSFSNIELPKTIDDIAIIEVKKLNEGKGSSNYYDIRNYAIKDKDFMKEQFKLINPDIIVCCSTGDYYDEDIFEDEPWIQLYPSPIQKCNCYKHGNRLVIDFNHPSYKSEAQSEELFETLCRLIKEGNVFEKFDWKN
jgi:hypothetical protein